MMMRIVSKRTDKKPLHLITRLNLLFSVSPKLLNDYTVTVQLSLNDIIIIHESHLILLNATLWELHPLAFLCPFISLTRTGHI